MLPHREIIKEFIPLLSELGFAEQRRPNDSIVFRRNDGTEILVSIERDGEDFSVELIPPGVRAGKGLSVALLIEALDPERVRRIDRAVGRHFTNTESIRYWWNEFCDFLRTQEHLKTLSPILPAVQAKYDVHADRVMRAFGFK